MGIGWLWHFTDAPGGSLRAQNEYRAARLHARSSGLRRLLGRWRDARRERALHRELDRLTDEQLLDVGLRRSGDGKIVATVADPRPPASARPATRASKRVGTGHVTRRRSTSRGVVDREVLAHERAPRPNGTSTVVGDMSPSRCPGDVASPRALLPPGTGAPPCPPM